MANEILEDRAVVTDNVRGICQNVGLLSSSFAMKTEYSTHKKDLCLYFRIKRHEVSPQEDGAVIMVTCRAQTTLG